MDKKSIIARFVYNRPEALGAYGYGSGVFKQAGYSENDEPQIDIIFVVDNLRLWHLKNILLNRSDYPTFGKYFISRSSIEDLKGRNNITYLSHIVEDGHRFKYGVIEEDDFLESLNNWGTFFIAGRFQKPTLRIISNKKEEEAINRNKELAVLVTALLSDSLISRKDFFRILCGLSYNGTLRMAIAENPNKINNIVEGNFDRLNDIYNLEVDYIESRGDMLAINHTKALKHIKELPLSLLFYFYENGYDVANIFSVRNGINHFLSEKNKTEELNTTFDSIKTNGIVRSTPYLLEKVKKRINGK